MHIFVPDTNFFLQCVDYQMLDWSLVTDDAGITIAVPRVVQREIDRHKDGGNARRASRARKAWTLFARVIDSADNRITMQVNNCTISMELLMPKIKADDFPDLDLQIPDDQIVAEALWLRQRRPDDSVTFLSNDTPALTTAKSQQLAFMRLPQQWALPPEKDERDKTIDELRKQVQTLSSQHPELAFALPDIADNRVSAEVTLFPALTEDDIATLMKEIGEHFPMEKHFPQEPPAREDDRIFGLAAMLANPFGQWRPASAQEIEQYHKNSYPKWLRRIESELGGIHHRLNADLLSAIRIVLSNCGQQPAKNLLVTYRTEGPLIFGIPPKRDEDNESNNVKPLLTPSPAPPTGAYVSFTDHFKRMTTVDFLAPGTGRSIPDLTSVLADRRRDTNRFYWKPYRPTDEATEWILECDEFRHQHEPYQLQVTVRPNPASEGDISGAIRCTAHASNLPVQIELVLPVRIHVERGDTLKRVRDELRLML